MTEARRPFRPLVFHRTVDNQTINKHAILVSTPKEQTGFKTVNLEPSLSVCALNGCGYTQQGQIADALTR